MISESSPFREITPRASSGNFMPTTPEGQSNGLSYKFQRLREKLREAITSGEFAGKLPGERQLAKRFNVNAKTLSKALTDLAAEGLLDRSIGRGTFVKGTAPTAPAQGRWLILGDAGVADSCLVAHLRRLNPEIAFASDFTQIRPSFLNGFSAVLDLSGITPDPVIRDLVVRNLPLIAVGHEPKTFAMHCVMPDISLAANKLGRDLLLAGHRRLVAVEAAGQTAVTIALRHAASRYAPDANVEPCRVSEIVTLLGDGAVAFVCDSVKSARLARTIIAENATTDVALVAVGCACENEVACSGYFADCGQVAEAVVNLLHEGGGRPTTLWLACQWIDRGTLVPSLTAPPIEASAERRILTGLHA